MPIASSSLAIGLRVARASSVAHLPAGVVPVAAIFGRVLWHAHEMAEADGDLLLTSRTQIRLARLVRLHARDGDSVVGVRSRHSIGQASASIRQAQSMPISPGEVTASAVSPTNV